MTQTSRNTIPWHLRLGAFGVTCAALGAEWDVSWHRSIGRDSFWTPAHMMIYLCGAIAAIIGITLTVQATRNRNRPHSYRELRAASVHLFGLRAPLGVFVAGWGGIAMLTAAPFDNWWHAAYGLDTQVVSPPHALLVLGIRLVDLGILLLAVSALNRATDAPVAAKLQRLILYLGGFIVTGQMFFMLAYTRDFMLHRASPYMAVGLAVPMALATVHFASRHRWSATIAAAIYVALLIAEILVFPLFPAHPELGPVFTPVTHLVPQKFPLLLIAPAFALDLLWQRTRTWKLLPLALVSGIVFIAVLLAVQWPFANFLLSHTSANRFFGTMYFPYDTHPDRFDYTRRFFFPVTGWVLARGLLLATLYATSSSYIGLIAGKWMRTLQR